MDEEPNRPNAERSIPNAERIVSSWQYGISQVLLWTAVAAIVVATIKFFPWAVLVAVLMAFLYVPIGPFAVVFAIIAFGKEKNGALAIDHVLVKILLAFWVVCVIFVLATCFVIYWGVAY